MTTHNVFRLLLLASLTLATTIYAQNTNPYARRPPAPTAVASAKGNAMDDPTTFATDGAKVLESIKGNLTGDGRSSVLVVLDPPLTGKEKLGEGPGRTVVLWVRDDTGVLHQASANSLIVPCASCGGAAGDPYAYSRIGRGQFTIVIGGGSRERWTDEYTFTYVGAKKDWFISSAVRKVVDTDTDKDKHVNLTARELGTVSFADFDPGKLPEVTLR
jgi:hypothetical protein